MGLRVSGGSPDAAPGAQEGAEAAEPQEGPDQDFVQNRIITKQ